MGPRDERIVRGRAGHPDTGPRGSAHRPGVGGGHGMRLALGLAPMPTPRAAMKAMSERMNAMGERSPLEGMGANMLMLGVLLVGAHEGHPGTALVGMVVLAVATLGGYLVAPRLTGRVLWALGVLGSIAFSVAVVKIFGPVVETVLTPIVDPVVKFFTVKVLLVVVGLCVLHVGSKVDRLAQQFAQWEARERADRVRPSSE